MLILISNRISRPTVRIRNTRVAEHFRWNLDFNAISAEMWGYGFKKERNSGQRHQLSNQSRQAMREFGILLWFVVSGAVASVAHLEVFKDFLDSVHRERSISTLLLMQRKLHKNQSSLDNLQLHYPLSWPIIRLDEAQRIQLANFLRKDTLAVVHMDSSEDSSLLSVLADNFNHMREVRIVIWLTIKASTKLLEIIAHQAAEHKFLSLLIIEKAERFLRLNPFPEPSFQELERPLEKSKIFPILWRNFMGKTALTLPDLVPPRTYVYTDLRTGRQRLSGYLYKLTTNFARKYNITLKMQRPLFGNESVHQWKLIESTIRGEIDLPMTGRLMNFGHPKLSRTDCFLGTSALTIVVPCGTELSVGERFILVYGMGSTYIYMASYILLSAVEVLFRRICDMIERRPSRLEVIEIILNLRLFRCLMGMSIPRGNQLRSVRGQLTMLMSFLGLMNACILGAQYSTLLTMRPQYQHIHNFQQLRESNLTVVFNYVILKMIREQLDHEFIMKTLPHVKVVDSLEQIRMIQSMNTSYAYQTYSYLEDPFSILQHRSYRKVLCKSPQLDIITGITYSAVLPQNSVYAQALREFAYYAWSVGLIPHWIRSAIREHFQAGVNLLPAQTGGNPMKLRDYKILSRTVLIFFTLAICVFMGEVLMGWKRQANN